VKLPVVLNAEWKSWSVGLQKTTTPHETAPAVPKLRTILLSCKVAIAPSPVLNVERSLEPQIASAIQVDRATWSSTPTFMGPGWSLTAQLNCINLPIDIAFRLTVRDSSTGQTYPGGQIYATKRGHTVVTVSTPDRGQYLTSHPCPQTVDLELRPEPSASPLGTREIWGQPLIIQGVHVTGTPMPSSSGAGNLTMTGAAEGNW